MGKVEVRIPHCVWRDGRPRFQPGPKLRGLGFVGRDLCDVPPREARSKGVDPRWWTLAEVETWIRVDLAPRITAAEEVDRGKKIRSKVRAALGAAHTAGPTVGELVGWASKRGAADGTPLRPNSVKFYRNMEGTLAALAPDLWSTPARAVRKSMIWIALTTIRDARSLHVAAGVRALLGRAWREATLNEWGGITEDPTRGIVMATPKGRLRAATVPEIRHLVAAADALGRPEVGDMIVLGVTIGQRQADRLALEKTAIRDGWVKIRQQKTGAEVEVYLDPWAKDRLDAAAARRRDWTVSPLNVVVNERARRPFAGQTYQHAFIVARDAAVAGIVRDGVTIIEPMPSLAGLRDQDLRDTFVTWAIESGMTAEQIASVTGHSPKSVQQMIHRHYGARTRPQARAVADAIAVKLANE